MSLLSAPGGSIFFIRQNGQSVEYSLSQVSGWSSIIFPCSIYNSNTAAGYVKVIFTNTITVDNSEYFSCTSEYIQFGSDTLPLVFINAPVDNYDGLIMNGTNNSPGYSNIRIYNLHINADGYFSQIGAGWVAMKYFGAGATDCYIIGCSSNGEIHGGGICGDYSETTIIGCYSSGTIVQGGGIAGAYSIVNIQSSWSNGTVNSGGICGPYCTDTTITDCYSTGIIAATSAGGICGANCSCTISNCYSSGTIFGPGSGGICGASASQVTISNCYSTGNINASNNAGGICGSGGSNITISHCYVSGAVNASKGYYVGNNGSATIISSYSEAYNSGSGWNNARAASVLLVMDIWIFNDADPFLLFNIGYSHYSAKNISDVALIRSYSITLVKGQSVLPIIEDGQYSFLDEVNGITIDTVSGRVTAIIPGTYVVRVKQGTSFSTLTVVVTEALRSVMQSLFTNNSQVYYKAGSLASGGVGTVRNCRIKAHRI